MIHVRAIFAAALAALVPQAAAAAQPSLNAESAVVADADGSVLWSKAPRFRCPPASTAKVAACLTAVETSSLDAWVTVSERAVGQEPTRVGLRAGERFRVGDLVRACLICSGNDAAVALAEGVGGSEAGFAESMTRKARSLGASDTVFRRASGLPAEGQWTTAADLVATMRAALRKPFLVKVLGIRETWIESSAGRRIELKTHNRYLGDENLEVFLKTGYTRASRSCFVGFVGRGAELGVFAFMSSPKPWPDVREIAEWCHSRRGSGAAGVPSPADIREVQVRLNAQGYDAGSPDGILGGRTRRALLAFQRSRGIPEAGRIGESTRRALGLPAGPPRD